VDLGQDIVQADVLLVLSHLRAGNHEAALQAAEALEQRLPTSPVPPNLKGVVLLAQRDYAGADAAFAAAQARDPKFLGAGINRARASAAAGQLQTAAAHYQGVLAAEPRNLAALLGLASLAQQQGDAVQAEDWLVRAHAAQPDAVQPTLQLAQWALRRNDGLRALALLNELLPTAAETPSAQLLRGMAQLSTGDTASATRTLQRVTELQPKLLEAWFQLARAQIAAGDFSAARSSAQRAEDLGGGRQSVLRMMQVELELRARDYAKALALARAYQADLPDVVELVDLESAAGQLLGDTAGWEAAARRAFDRHPTSRRALVLSQSLAALGRSADAVVVLRGWVEREPEDVTARTTLALLLHQAGQREEAAKAYEQVVARAPANAPVLNNLAVLYQELGDPRAADTARRAYELAPQRPEIVDTYGWILVQRGQVAEGLVLLQEAHVTSPQHPEIAYHVGAALARSGRAAEARPILERVVREHAGTQAARDAQALLGRL
jgi:putative PEP-CTERM system TPR-repeat lipoprotein